MAPRVHIKTLKLAGFRNYASLSLTLDQRHLVLAGDNGAGKTNLMEALSLLTPGRGFRRAAYGEMIKAGSAPGTGFSVFRKPRRAWPGRSIIGTASTAAKRAWRPQGADQRCACEVHRCAASNISGCCG